MSDKDRIPTEEEILNQLPQISWGLDFSNYKCVISGNTKEVYEYEHPVHFGGKLRSRHRRKSKRNSRIRRPFSITRARMHIRRLISANVDQYGCRSLFITFTFKENIIVLKEANKAWSDFIARLRYYLKFSVKYVAVVEFQKRGAVHYHAVFFNIPYIENIKTEFADLWGHGHIKIEATKKIHSIGAYLSKYLQKGVVDARLFNEKCYFTSRGLIKPTVIRIPPVDVDFGTPPIIERLEEEKEYQSQWTGKIVYRRYRVDQKRR
jgi:hypothetical protein